MFLCLAPLRTQAAAPAHIAESIPNAHLSGSGSLSFFGLQIYDAQLWVGDGGYKPDAPLASPFAIDLNYARSFDGIEIAKTSRKEMERMNYGTAAQQEQWFGQMKAIFPNVQKGQHITGVFLPNGEQAGVKFFFNGKPIGSISDAEFARAFAAIWLDARTKAGKVREQMLGLSQ